jgi:hypothetical protein
MTQQTSTPKLVFDCRADNDLYRVLADLGLDLPRYDSLREALDATPGGAGVLSLADAYPRPGLTFDPALADLAATKGVRLYLEYPSALPGIDVSPPRLARWERVVVSSDRLPQLAQGTILAQHGCWYTPVEAAGGTDLQATLCVARVAGYDRAIYGMPEDPCPLLFELPAALCAAQTLVATSKLSQFVRGRYAPQRAWQALWEDLLAWLVVADIVGDDDVGGTDLPPLTWTPTVRVHAGPQTPLGEDVEARAFSRSLRWFRDQAVWSIAHKKGAIEGFESAIDVWGRQMRRTWVRGDCCAETAMVFAFHWAAARDPGSRQLATGILDTVWSPDFCQPERSPADDTPNPAYGLNNWYERGPVFYGDDNARVILASLAARSLLGDLSPGGERRWDERVLRCLLANLRTTGINGFRRNRIDLSPLLEHGWRFYAQEATISVAPHYQAYLWAAFLLAYRLTGYSGFLIKPKKALRITMEAYPNWRWTNGFTQELARMLLPLAFLVRIEGTAGQRAWLARVADDLLAQMQPSGAIYERLGALENGRYAPPQTNEEYGTTEASLIQANGDPACDLLYTANYALLGLHEAAAATGDERLGEATDRLARFLCRIQVRSEFHPWLDGAWMRSFDDNKWEVWGSSADAGWGAWCIETGWTNTWIASVLAMRAQGTTLFELATKKGLEDTFPALRDEMLS